MFVFEIGIGLLKKPNEGSSKSAESISAKMPRKVEKTSRGNKKKIYQKLFKIFLASESFSGENFFRGCTPN